MAKLNTEAWNDRQAAASALLDEEDEAFLRPPAPAAPGRKRKADPDLVPNENAEQFLRTRRRIAPRKSWGRRLLATRVGRGLLGLLLLAGLASAGYAAWAVANFLRHDPHFRIDSSASIQAMGNTELSRAELLKVFGSDIGRNVFFVPLAKREAALEGEPWVKHATVMRLLPDTLRVTLVERIPVAFVRLGRQIGLVDGEGILLPMAPATLAARHYSFPVVVGLDPNAPAEARAKRMRLYGSFVTALDAGGGHVSSQLSEVDVSDLEDVRAVVPAQGSDLLLHFGNSDFLERYRSYLEHLPEWRQQYPNLSAVDLRYDRQVVLKMADAAQADEAREAEEAKRAAAAETAGKGTGSLGKGTSPGSKAHHPVPTVARSAPPAHPANHAAAAKPGGARTWYTERPGPHHSVRWVPHYLPNAGKGTAR